MDGRLFYKQLVAKTICLAHRSEGEKEERRQHRLEAARASDSISALVGHIGLRVLHRVRPLYGPPSDEG